MTLQEMLLADADGVLNDLPGEGALYLPATGAPRSIKVVVQREGEQVNPDPRAALQPLVVCVKNSTVGGISGDELTPQDCLRLAKDKGGEQVSMRIKRLRDENAGWLELELL